MRWVAMSKTEDTILQNRRYSLEPSTRGPTEERSYAEEVFLEFFFLLRSFQGCRLTIDCRGS